jgi:hypothetical protein
MRKRRPRLAAARRALLTAFGNAFFKGGLSRNAAFGMKRTRHQLAPAMPGKKIVDRALAGLVPDRLFVGRLEIVDVQQFTCAGSPGKTRQQRLFIRHGHVLAFAPATWLAFQCIEAAVVIGHVSPVHRAQRNSHRFRNRRLRHSALAKQHHLDALALPGMSFPTQRCLQTPNLAFGAFNHLRLRIRSDRRERITVKLSNPIHSRVRCLATANRRFNQLWKRYETRQRKLELEPESGEELQALIKKAYATPKPIIERIGKLVR